MNAVIAAQIAPRAIEIAKSLLVKLAPHLGKAAQAVTAGAEVVSSSVTTAAETATSASAFNARELLHGFVPDLNSILAYINIDPEAFPEISRKLDVMIKHFRVENCEVSMQHMVELVSTLGEIAGLEPDKSQAAPGDGQTAQTTTPASQTVNPNGDNKQPSQTAGDDTNIVIKNLLEIVMAKVGNPGGHINTLYTFFVQPIGNFLGYDLPEVKDLPAYVQKEILTDQFKGLLGECIEGKQVDTEKLPGYWQQKAFGHCQKILQWAGSHSDAVTDKGPRAAWWLRQSGGFICAWLSRIPIVGWILVGMFPFALDFLGSTGEQRSRLEQITNVLKKHAKPTEQAANPQATSQPQAAPQPV